MYKAGYDPNSYVAFFGKVMEEERRMPGSMPQVFMDHPPTGDRIIKSEEEIKQILPKKEQYLVSTSEFDDVKARLQQVISNRKKLKPGETGGPTLRKRQPSDQTSAPTQTAGQSSGSSGAGDRPAAGAQATRRLLFRLGFQHELQSEFHARHDDRHHSEFVAWFESKLYSEPEFDLKHEPESQLEFFPLCARDGRSQAWAAILVSGG